jgi:hypothetical protein
VEVIVVLSVDRHADDTGDDGASLFVIDVEVEHLLLMNMPGTCRPLSSRIGAVLVKGEDATHPVGPYEATTTGLTVSFSRWSDDACASEASTKRSLLW